MTRVNLVLFTLLAFIWGASYTFIKVAVDGLTPAQLVLARVFLGAVVLLVVLRATGAALPRSLAVWGHTVVTAVLGMVAPFLLLAWGEQRTSAAMAGVLIAATPLLTLAAVTAVLPGERGTWRKGVGFVGGFLGVVLVIGPWSVDGGSFAGQMAVLGAAACYALQTVYVKKMLASRGIPPLVSATTQVITATVLQAAVTPFFPWSAPSLDAGVVISVVLLGVVGTGLAYLIYFRLIGDLGAANASAVNYLVPVTAVLVSLVTLGEAISWNMVVGTLVVLASLAFAENRLAMLRPSTSREPADAK